MRLLIVKEGREHVEGWINTLDEVSPSTWIEQETAVDCDCNDNDSHNEGDYTPSSSDCFEHMSLVLMVQTPCCGQVAFVLDAVDQRLLQVVQIQSHFQMLGGLPHCDVVAQAVSLYPRVARATTAKGTRKGFGGGVHPN